MELLPMIRRLRIEPQVVGDLTCVQLHYDRPYGRLSADGSGMGTD